MYIDNICSVVVVVVVMISYWKDTPMSHAAIIDFDGVVVEYLKIISVACSVLFLF